MFQDLFLEVKNVFDFHNSTLSHNLINSPFVLSSDSSTDICHGSDRFSSCFVVILLYVCHVNTSELVEVIFTKQDNNKFT
jgi:hypothetical protein